jgi:hypothetical protein
MRRRAGSLAGEGRGPRLVKSRVHFEPFQRLGETFPGETFGRRGAPGSGLAVASEHTSRTAEKRSRTGFAGKRTGSDMLRMLSRYCRTLRSPAPPRRQPSAVRCARVLRPRRSEPPLGSVRQKLASLRPEATSGTISVARSIASVAQVFGVVRRPIVVRQSWLGRDESLHHQLAPGVVEIDSELRPVRRDHAARPEFDVEDARAGRKAGRGRRPRDGAHIGRPR